MLLLGEVNRLLQDQMLVRGCHLVNDTSNLGQRDIGAVSTHLIAHLNGHVPPVTPPPGGVDGVSDGVFLVTPVAVAHCGHVMTPGFGCVNPRPVRGGVDATPPMSFSELDATPFGGSC